MKHLPPVEKIIARIRAWLDPAVRGILRARTLGLAAEMSFWLFLSLVPLAAVAGWLGARLAVRYFWVEGALLTSVPPAMRTMLQGEVEQVAALRGDRVAPAALAIFVWLGASGVHAVFDALEVQTGSERPWWKKRLLAIAACVGLSVGIAVLGLLTLGVGWLMALVGHEDTYRTLEATTAGAVARTVLGLGVALAMVAGLYRLGIPREARTRLVVMPGAAFAVLLIGMLGSGYRFYLSTTAPGSVYQGGLAVIGVTLTTLWLFSVAILLGAELNKVVSGRRDPNRRQQTPAPGPGLDARGPDRLAGTLPAATRAASLGKKGSTPGRARWSTFAASSFRPTSPRPPILRSTGRSRWPGVSARGSR
ncbi:MAG TPA: YhjD/YihY/BrkB family envelope integrity protein [Polyangiaceae bacterium]|nr:YhjD/YihY/BrkB family envelope integrity protein [Polyangiaceae bacterium]